MRRIVSGVGMRDVSSRLGPFGPKLAGQPSPRPWSDDQSHFATAGSDLRNAEKRPKTIGGGKSSNSPPQPRFRVSPVRKCPREPNPTSFVTITVAYQARNRPACSECGRQYFPYPSGKGRIKERVTTGKDAKGEIGL